MKHTMDDKTGFELPPEKIGITQGQMNLVLMAVEHGFKQREKGNNLEAALASVFELYEVKKLGPQ